MTSTCHRWGTAVGEPQAVGFVTTGLPAAAVAGLACGLLVRRSPWLLLLLVPAWLLLAWLFQKGPCWLAMCRNRFCRCPRCGGRDWSWPRCSGFGL
jgi:hypothetical protein